jgi:hypothetical protein
VLGVRVPPGLPIIENREHKDIKKIISTVLIPSILMNFLICTYGAGKDLSSMDPVFALG